MGTEEEEVQVKGIPDIFNQKIAENISNLEKEKTISTENKERILKAVREKNQINYKG
jgi:hypothetical protein